MCVRCRARARTGNGGLFLRDGTATLRSRRLWVLPGGGGGARGAVRVLGLGFPKAPPDSLALAIPNTASIRSAIMGPPPPPPPPPDDSAAAKIPAANVVVIAPGSLMLRIGSAATRKPITMPNVMACRSNAPPASSTNPGENVPWLFGATESAERAALFAAEERHASGGRRRGAAADAVLPSSAGRRKFEVNHQKEERKLFGWDAATLPPDAPYELIRPFAMAANHDFDETVTAVVANDRIADACGDIWTHALLEHDILPPPGEERLHYNENGENGDAGKMEVENDTQPPKQEREFEETPPENSTLRQRLSAMACVLVVPEYVHPRLARTLVERTLLTTLGFGYAVLLRGAPAAAFGAGAAQASAVVHVGASVTTVACVEDGCAIPDTLHVLPHGGCNATESLAERLLSAGTIEWPSTAAAAVAAAAGSSGGMDTNPWREPWRSIDRLRRSHGIAQGAMDGTGVDGGTSGAANAMFEPPTEENGAAGAGTVVWLPSAENGVRQYDGWRIPADAAGVSASVRVASTCIMDPAALLPRARRRASVGVVRRNVDASASDEAARESRVDIYGPDFLMEQSGQKVEDGENVADASTPSGSGREDTKLAQAVVASVEAATPGAARAEMRRRLYGSIVLCGGCANMRGLADDLTASVRSAMNAEDKLTMDASVTTLAPDSRDGASAAPTSRIGHVTSGTAAWFGGAVVGLVDTSREGWVSAHTVAHGRCAMPNIPLREPGVDHLTRENATERGKIKGSEPMLVFLYGTPGV